MVNKILFSVIILLMISILAVGALNLVRGSAEVPSGERNGEYTLSQVAEHNTKEDCYTAIRGNVYNLTSFIASHPGGEAILTLCGIEGTALFEEQHGGQDRPESVISGLQIGVLLE